MDEKLARRLVLDELYDLSLYRSLRDVTTGDVRKTLEELIEVETKHYRFWQDFFKLKLPALDLGRRLKLRIATWACRLFGDLAVHLILEAMEVYGVRKYLTVWEAYRGAPLGSAVREVLEDEFGHEDRVVTELTERKINPERVRNIFLGLNDGLVEIVGAVGGFFGAFGDPGTVSLAALLAGIAGSLSMGAGAYVASSSEQEVARTDRYKSEFLGEAEAHEKISDRPLTSAVVVGSAYFCGALVPVLPVILGAKSVFFPFIAAASVIFLVSVVLSFLSGMELRKRALLNLAIVAGAVIVTYAIGSVAKAVWGISL